MIPWPKRFSQYPYSENEKSQWTFHWDWLPGHRAGRSDRVRTCGLNNTNVKISVFSRFMNRLETAPIAGLHSYSYYLVLWICVIIFANITQKSHKMTSTLCLFASTLSSHNLHIIPFLLNLYWEFSRRSHAPNSRLFPIKAKLYPKERKTQIQGISALVR